MLWFVLAFRPPLFPLVDMVGILICGLLVKLGTNNFRMLWFPSEILLQKNFVSKIYNFIYISFENQVNKLTAKERNQISWTSLGISP